MNTIKNCIARDVVNQARNPLQKLLNCEAFKTNREIIRHFSDKETTEFLYTFKDGSTVRVIMLHETSIKFTAMGVSK